MRIMKITSREKGILLKPVSLEIKIKYLSCLTNAHFIIKASYYLKIGGRLNTISKFHRRVKGNAGNYKAVLKQYRKTYLPLN